jgi:hypothetical protein
VMPPPTTMLSQLMNCLPRCSGASKGGSGIFARAKIFRCRRVKNAALLTRPPRRCHLEVSGREASRSIDARSPRGVEQEAIL